MAPQAGVDGQTPRSQAISIADRKNGKNAVATYILLYIQALIIWLLKQRQLE